LLPFFDACSGSTFRLGKTYKKEDAQAAMALCRCPRMNVVILPTKKEYTKGLEVTLKNPPEI